MSESLTAAARELLAALAWSREPYIPTARNAPPSGDVRARKDSRLREAERRLRDALEGADG